MRYVGTKELGEAAEALAIACATTKDADGLRLFGEVSLSRIRGAVLGAMTALFDGTPVLEEGTVVVLGFGMKRD